MLILELAVQAVRGFSPSARVALRPGYLGLQSATEIPAPLAGLVIALIYPDGRGGEASFLAPGASAGRAGFSVQSNDGTVWRLVRDLGGSGALHRLNRQSNQFEVVSDDAAEMAQQLRASVGFPVRTSFEQLFTFTSGQLPTRRLRAPKQAPGAARSGPALGGGFGGGSPVQPTSDVEATRGKIVALETELARARSIGELQFRLDGVQSEIFSTEQKLKVYLDKKTEVEQARAELASAPTPKSLGLPEDIADRVRKFGEVRKKHAEAMAKVTREREGAMGSGPVTVDPLGKDPRFLAALGAGVLLLLGASFLEGGLRYAALLSIPAFSFAALLALRFVEDLQAASRETAKGDVFDQREKKLRDDFELQAAIVNTAMSKVNAITDDEFFAAFARRDALQPRLAQLGLELADLESDSDVMRLPEVMAQLKRDLEVLSAQVTEGSGGYMRDAREIEREIAYLKESLAPPPPRATTGEFAAVNAGPAETFDDPIPSLMILGADLFATDVPSLWGALHDRVLQYLTALTDRRYHGVVVDKDGRAVVQAPGRDVPAGELPGRDLDLLYLSTRLTLIEKYSAQAKLPVILEDTFGALLDATKQPLFGRMLKHLGTLTQVLHVTGAGQTVVAADVVLPL